MTDPFKSLDKISKSEDIFSGLDSIKKPMTDEEREKEYGVIRTAPPRWLESIKQAAETGGMMGGEAVGSMAGVPGKIIGGTLGYAIPRTIGNAVETALGYRKPPESLWGGFMEGVENLKTGGEMALGGPVIGKVGGKVAQSLYAPFGERLVTQEGQSLLNLYKQYGINPVPSELAKGGNWQKTLGIFEGILGYRPLTGDVMLKRSMETLEAMNSARTQLIAKGAPNETVELVGKRIRDEARIILSKYGEVKGARLESMVSDFENRFGFASPSEAGSRFQATMSIARKTAKEAIDASEETLTGMLPGSGTEEVANINTVAKAKELLEKETSGRLPTQRTVSWLNKIKGKEAELPEGVTQKMLDRDPELKSMVEGIADNKPTTWQGMREDKGKLQDRIAKIYRETGGKGTIESNRLKQVVDAIDDDMKNYAESQGGDIWKQYLENRKNETRFYDLFDKDILGVINGDPHVIAKKIIRSGDVTLARQIQAIAGEDGVTPIRQVFFKDMVDEGMRKGKLSDTIDKSLYSLRRQGGQEVVDLLLTQEQQKVLDKIVKTGKNFDWRMKNMDVTEFLSTIADGHTDKIVDTIFKPKSTEFIKIAKKVLSEDRITEIKSMALEKVLKEGGGGNFLPVSSAKEANNYRNSLMELMPEKFKTVFDFIKLGQYMNQVEKMALNPSQTGQILVGSGMLNQATSNPKAVIGTLGIPYIAARIYMSESAMKWFSKAKVLPPGIPQSIDYFSRAVKIALSEGSDDNKQQVDQP